MPGGARPRRTTWWSRRARCAGGRGAARVPARRDRQPGRGRRPVRRRRCATSLDADAEVFLMGDGEEAKTLATVEDLCRRFAGLGAAARRRGRRARRWRRRRHRRLRGRDVPPRHRGAAGADDAARDGRRRDRRQDRGEPARGQEPGRRVPPAGRGGRRHRHARHAARREYRSGLGEVAKYALLGDVVADPTGLVELLRLQTTGCSSGTRRCSPTS